MIQIRAITSDEVAPAHAALAAAGLSIPRDLLAFYVELAPGGYLAAWEKGRVVGTVGAVRYEGYTFIGAMAVRPEAQGRGIGRALLGRLLADLAADGVDVSVLEATDAGYPLYKSYGFVESYRTLVYRREESESDLDCQLARELVAPLTPDLLDEVVALDARATGARRGKLLAALLDRCPERAFVARERTGALAGYAIAGSTRIGPWVATEPRSAEALLDAALTLPYEQGPTVALPGPNSAGGALLLRAGFSPQRSTRRMWRGPQPPAGTPTLVYGLAALGLG